MAKWALILILSALPASALAAGGAYAPIFQLGTSFHTGTTGKSITGAMGYDLSFRAEARKGVFRPKAGVELEFSSGLASVDADEPNFSMYGASFLPGFNIFVFQDSRFTPYVGVAGVIGWQHLKLPTPPGEVEGETQSLAFGYEVSAGVDIRKSGQGMAVRLESSLLTATGKLAGISGFQLHAWKVSIGFVW